MNRFALIAAVGCFALALTACGQQDNKQPTATTTDTTTSQPAPAQPAGGNQTQTQNH